MRIGLISPPWIALPPPAYGGTEAVVERLARGLQDAGHDVLLAAASDSTCPVPLVPGLDPSEPRRLGESVPELRHVIAAYRALSEAGVDLIHDHTLIGPLFGLRPPGTPVVTTMHGPVESEMGDIYRAMSERTAMVAISEHQAGAAGGVAAAAVIHHGMDVHEVPVGDGSGGYLCFLGRFHPTKGAREAVLIARRAGVPVKLAGRVSEPLEKDYFRERVQPLLGPDAEYVGELGPADKYALLGGALAMANPISWPEPFGLVMIEALATGTPVLTTREGSAPELIEEGVTGFLRDDVEGLADCVALLADVDRADCRAAAETRFSTRRMVEDHVALYTRLLAVRAAPVFTLTSAALRTDGAPAGAAPEVGLAG